MNNLKYNYALSPNGDIFLKQYVAEVSDLGVILDNKIHWDQHIKLTIQIYRIMDHESDKKSI